jgi:hypothetical protein
MPLVKRELGHDSRKGMEEFPFPFRGVAGFQGGLDKVLHYLTDHPTDALTPQAKALNPHPRTRNLLPIGIPDFIHIMPTPVIQRMGVQISVRPHFDSPQ